MPRPADDLRAQLAAEDPDFVAALLDDRVWPIEGFPAGDGKVFRGGGLVYHKRGKGVAVYAPPTHLRDGTEIDTDLTGLTEDAAVTPFDGRLFRNGGYGLRVGGVTVRFGGPERRISGVWRPCVLSNRTRRGDTVTWDNEWGGVYAMRLTAGGVETRWTFAVRPQPIRVALVVQGSVVGADGTVPLAGGESFTIHGARWSDSTTPDRQTGLIPFATQGGYLPLVLPAGLVYPVRVDG